MKARILLPLAVLALASLACGFSLGQTNDDKPTAGGDQPAEAEVLFSDDFSKKNSGWGEASDESGVTEYADGEYRIQVNETNYYLWSNPERTFSDVSVEVDARVAVDKGGDMGIICRYQDDQNFYILRVTSDGYYGISKLVDGEESLLGSDELPSSDAIETGTTTNHLRADCIGDRLTLSVNGQVIADVKDSDLTNGDVGLLAGTFDDPGTEVFFDNFVVTRP